jgi:hypothetical protein
VKPTLFQKEPNFNPLNASDPRWTSLLPPGKLPSPSLHRATCHTVCTEIGSVGGGFVKVPSWREYPLLPVPVQAPSDGTESYNVAVFHQLHCLHSIAGLVEELLAPSANAKATPIRTSRRKHIEHCFEYLRLALRCCGDGTLEGQGKTVEKPGIDGFGSWHLCRDYESISTWATEHRAADRQDLPT